MKAHTTPYCKVGTSHNLDNLGLPNAGRGRDELQAVGNDLAVGNPCRLADLETYRLPDFQPGARQDFGHAPGEPISEHENTAEDERAPTRVRRQQADGWGEHWIIGASGIPRVHARGEKNALGVLDTDERE